MTGVIAVSAVIAGIVWLGPSGPLRTVAKGAVPPVTSVLAVTAVTLPIVTPQGAHGPTAAAVIARGRAPVTSVDYRAGRDRRDSANLRHGPSGARATVAAATAVTGRAFVTRPGGGQGPPWAP